MKIMMIITRGDEYGGAQIHVRELCKGLAGAGHVVHVVAGSGGLLTEELASFGIRTEICPALHRQIHPTRDLRSVAQLRRIIRDVRPDLVCAHSTKAGIVGRIAAKVSGVPCIFTAHGWAFVDAVPQPQRTIYRTLELVSAPLATRIICVSEHDRRVAIAAGISTDRLAAVHNGMPDVAASHRARPGIGGPLRVVMVARFAVPKDHRTLIEALRGVAGAELDLIGDGPELESVRAFAHDAGMADRVHFLGQRDDVAAILAQSHVFVLCSDREGFPLSTLEAMRAGLPVIVSDVGGAPEAIVDGVTGFLAPARDPGALLERLKLLAAEPERRAAMGAAGRTRYEAEFTFTRMLAKTTEVYDSVLAARPHAGWRGRRFPALRRSDDTFELTRPVALTAKDTTGGT